MVLRFQLCSAHFTTLQAKNSRRSTSVINLVTTENMDKSHLQMWEAIVLLQINTLSCQQKEMEHKGGKWYVHDTFALYLWYAKMHLLG